MIKPVYNMLKYVDNKTTYTKILDFIFGCYLE